MAKLEHYTQGGWDGDATVKSDFNITLVYKMKCKVIVITITAPLLFFYV